MTAPLIYHGTPFTPRAALEAVGPGRAFCVSFWRPQSVEVVEAISPAVMFRQRRVLGMDGSAEARRTLVHPRGLDALLRMARAPAVRTWTLGGDTRCAGRAFADQRFLAAHLAIRSIEGRAPLAYGRPDRTALAPVRAVRSGLPWLDRNGAGREPRCRVRGVVSAHGRDRPVSRQSTALAAPHARRPSRAGVRLHHERGRHQRGAERSAL